MKTKLKKLFRNPVFNIGLIGALTGLVLWLTLKDNGDQVIHMLVHANKLVLVCIALFMLLERWIHAYGLKLQCNISTPRYTHFQGFINSYTAALFNNITPGASGGQFVQLFIFRKQGVAVPNAIGVLWLDFIIYQTVMAIFVLFLLIFKFMYFYTQYSQLFFVVIIGFFVNSAVILFLIALVKFPWFYRWLTTTGISIGSKLHFIKDKEQTKNMIDDQLTKFDREVVVLQHNKKMIIIVGISIVLRLLIYYSVPSLAAVSLGLKMTPDLWFNMLALCSFVSMINAFVPSPGSSGGTEATFILMFSTLFTSVQARSIMLIWRLFTFYFQTIVGVLLFMYGRTCPEPIADTIQSMPIQDMVSNDKINNESLKEIKEG